MTPETLLLRPPPLAREPRGAEPAALAALLVHKATQALAKAGKALWHVLEEEGRRRALREMRLRGSSPELLKALSDPAREAAQVLELAAQHERTDPAFAADLRAAAWRHEAMHEEATSRATPRGTPSCPATR